VLLLLVACCLQPVPANADWAGDEAHIKQLRELLSQLKSAVEVYERQRRSLELVEAEFAGLQLPLADPSASPEKLVRQLVAKSFPDVQISMRKVAARAPLGVEIWKWECSARGAIEEIRWATQLLLQKGLFVLPSPEEPVELRLDEDQRSAVLSFTGHHIRLKEIAHPKLPSLPTEPDALARRTDPLADQIRQLRAEVLAVRARAVEIMIFEARVEAMRLVIRHLKSLTKGGRDPFRVFTPLLDLELVRYSALRHTGDELRIRGDVPSESARAAAERWFVRHGRRKVRYLVDALQPMYLEPSTQAIKAADMAVTGPRCSLLLAGARAVDLGAATGARAAVSVGWTRFVSGQIEAPAEQALQSTAHRLGLELVKSEGLALFVARKRASRATECLRAKPRIARPGPLLALRQRGKAKDVLAQLRRKGKRPIEVPGDALDSGQLLTLSGRAHLADWLRLVGAGLGLRLAESSGKLRLVSDGADTAPLAAVSPAEESSDGSAPPLAVLRARVLLSCGARRVAVVGEPGGPAIVARPGARLGRSRARVARVDSKGVTVRWADSGLQAAVLLPFGERPRTIAPARAFRALRGGGAIAPARALRALRGGGAICPGGAECGGRSSAPASATPAPPRKRP
jgi:hypothetical protein